MKQPIDMTQDQLFKWTEKTGISIHRQVARCGTMENQRVYELLDRYEALRSEMMERGIWVEYCEARNFSTAHDGYDCAA